MASPAQIHANQQNAQKSTGPRTPEGKAASSANSRRHGLTGKLRLDEQMQAALDEIREGLHDAYDPRDEREYQMVERLAEATIRLRIARNVENEMYARAVADLEEETGGEIYGEEAFARCFLDPKRQKAMSLFMRYLHNIERSYYRALDDCEAMRKQHERDDLVVRKIEWVNGRSATVKPTPSADSGGNGFVSQSAAAGYPAAAAHSPAAAASAAPSRR